MGFLFKNQKSTYFHTSQAANSSEWENLRILTNLVGQINSEVQVLKTDKARIQAQPQQQQLQLVGIREFLQLKKNCESLPGLAGKIQALAESDLKLADGLRNLARHVMLGNEKLQNRPVVHKYDVSYLQQQHPDVQSLQLQCDKQAEVIRHIQKDLIQVILRQREEYNGGQQQQQHHRENDENENGQQQQGLKSHPGK